jgi:hypothetical protein
MLALMEFNAVKELSPYTTKRGISIGICNKKYG